MTPDQIKAALAESIARLPQVERSLEEIIFAGFYRICWTERMLKAHAEDSEDAEREYWERALQGESGHAALMASEILAWKGPEALEMMARYEPAPAIKGLMRDSLHDYCLCAVYRAYLEFAINAAPTPEPIRSILPQTVALHETADHDHLADTLEYLCAGWDKKAIRLYVQDVEHAIAAEIRHKGFPRDFSQ